MTKQPISVVDIPSAVRALSKKYRKENHCSNWDINNGLCAYFASDLIQLIGGNENDSLHELAGDMFFNVRDPEFALENWGPTNQTKYGVWSLDMIQHWGLPEGFNIEKVDDEINHVWVFANGKRYDAECPHGVSYWYEIPLVKRIFEKVMEK